MKAQILKKKGGLLEFTEIPRPRPTSSQILIDVHVCGVCRTDLHILDGELEEAIYPLIPGHQIVGTVVSVGASARFSIGERVGVPWLGWACGICPYCKEGKENLCDRAKFTGYTINGGFATYAVADARYCFSIPKGYTDEQVAPLLCGGLVGYRALRKTHEAKTLGLYGFGSSAHIIIQIAHTQKRKVFVFTRTGDKTGQKFARSLGATWAGSSEQSPPELLDAAIIFAPVGELIPKALRDIKKGGRVVCAGIHMTRIPEFPYNILWGEKILTSVSNLTRKDGEEFFRIVSEKPIKTTVTTYPLEDVLQALTDIRDGNRKGSAVVTMKTSSKAV